MNALLMDLRYGARTLVKSRGFTLAAVVVLTLGIGANTAIFSVVNAVLLKPLPFPRADRLVRIWHVPPPASFPGRKIFAVSPANYFDWESHSRSFEKMAIYGFASLNLTGFGEPEALTASGVSRDFFSVLGARPALGRAFTPQENEPGNGRVVVLSHDLWKTRFGGDAGIVGRDIRVNGEAYRVVGVMGPGFRIPEWARAWVPLAWNTAERAVRNNHNRLVVARLKPGVTLQAAQAEMDTISRRLESQYPEDDKGWGAAVVPLQQDLVGDVRPLLLILLGAVGFVLLIACANVANLMLARTLGRRKEIAVRCALGANRTRLYQQLLSEALLLSLSGGALGLLLAGLGVDGLVAFLSEKLPHFGRITLDGRVLLFTLAISVATGALAGIAPAWRLTSQSLSGPLKEGIERTASGAGEGPVRGALVVSEVALSLVLLVGAGLLTRSLWVLSRVDPGFDPRNVLTLTTRLPYPKYSEPSRRIAFVHQALENLRALPGVESAGAVDDLPMTDASNYPIALEGRPLLPVAQQPIVVGTIVSGDYFRSLRIPLKRGRLLTPADDFRAPGAIVVSESMARRFWPGEEAIGKRLTTVFFPAGTLHVVGIVGDVKQNGLDRREAVEQMYLAFEQAPTSGIQFTIRSAAGSPALVSAAVAAIHQVDPDQPLLEVKTMDRLLADSISSRRFTMALLAAFAALALALAGIGIYSVLAYSVRRRGHEIGVRMALGARTGQVVQLVVLQGMRPTILGMAIGLAAALALGRILSSLLYGVGPSDPATLAAVATLLAFVSLAACLVPAYRAARIDPMEALRSE